MWIVLLSCKGGFKVHSTHVDKAKAECWRLCKEHDGEDSSLAEIADDLVFEMSEMLANHKENPTAKP